MCINIHIFLNNLCIVFHPFYLFFFFFIHFPFSVDMIHWTSNQGTYEMDTWKTKQDKTNKTTQRRRPRKGKASRALWPPRHSESLRGFPPAWDNF